MKELTYALSLSKCQFRKEAIEYVGHKVTKDGLKADAEEVRAVLNMKVPENKKIITNMLRFDNILTDVLN